MTYHHNIILSKEIEQGNYLHNLQARMVIEPLKTTKKAFLTTTIKTYENYELKNHQESRLVLPLVDPKKILNKNKWVKAVKKNEFYKDMLKGSEHRFLVYLSKKYNHRLYHYHQIQRNIDLEDTVLDIVSQKWYPGTEHQKDLLIGFFNIDNRSKRQKVFLDLQDYGLTFEDMKKEKNYYMIDELIDKTERTKKQIDKIIKPNK